MQKHHKMKKILLIALLFSSIVQAQVFKGKGDQKFQVGANIQEHARGIIVSFDKGLGDNFSVGVATGYLLNTDKINTKEAKFEDKFDLKLRFNANIADVFKLEDNFDFYPGLNLSLKNFGAHLGARFFFTDGFGVYSEVQFPLAYYDKNVIGVENYNNQFNFSIGFSFNL